MFEAVTYANSSMPGPSVDVGSIAESLIFYQRVSVLCTTGTIRSLLEQIPPFVLLSLMKDKRLTLYYLEDQIAVYSELVPGKRQHHGLTSFSSPNHTVEQVARKAFVEAAGQSSQAKIAARTFEKLLLPLNHQLFNHESVLRVIEKTKSTEIAVGEMLRVLSPGYETSGPIRFRINRTQKGFVVDTNIEFEKANAIYNSIVPPSHSSLSEASILARLHSANEHLHFSALLGTEMALDRTAEKINTQSLEALLRERSVSNKQIENFREVAFKDVPSIREAVNARRVAFADVVRLLNKADKFRDWLSKQPPTTELGDEYLKAVKSETWADKLPVKAVKFGVFSGIGALIDTQVPGNFGTALGLAANAIDDFYIERLLQGWKPHYFVDRELIPMLIQSK
jgi:hypothetical protein